MRVTVKQALKKGQLTVNIPVFIIMFGIMCSLFYFSSIKVLPFYFTPLSFVIGPLMAWVYWSFAVVKWKLWAFKNVRNRHELKQKAIRVGLIWNDSSFFNKTEIWTEFQKEQWKKINKKFEIKDVVKDDLSIPFETILKYSKLLFWFNIIGIVFLISYSVYLYSDENEFSLTIILFLVYAIFLSYSTTKKSTKNLFIKLNEKGIETHNIDFLSWSEIQKIKVYRSGFGKSTKYFLKFSYKKNQECFEEKLNLMYYTYDFDKIEDLIKIYKKRYTTK